jgi:hypothetical protein
MIVERKITGVNYKPVSRCRESGIREMKIFLT